MTWQDHRPCIRVGSAQKRDRAPVTKNLRKLSAGLRFRFQDMKISLVGAEKSIHLELETSDLQELPRSSSAEKLEKAVWQIV